jgi:hypothetical protein
MNYRKKPKSKNSWTTPRRSQRKPLSRDKEKRRIMYFVNIVGKNSRQKARNQSIVVMHVINQLIGSGKNNFRKKGSENLTSIIIDVYSTFLQDNFFRCSWCALVDLREVLGCPG